MIPRDRRTKSVRCAGERSAKMAVRWNSWRSGMVSRCKTMLTSGHPAHRTTGSNGWGNDAARRAGRAHKREQREGRCEDQR